MQQLHHPKYKNLSLDYIHSKGIFRAFIMSSLTKNILVTCFSVLAITSCGDSSKEPVSQVQEALEQAVKAGGDTVRTTVDNSLEEGAEQWTKSEQLNELADELNSELEPKSTVASGDIPYPLYPNGSKYRIGGENGLRIVLFQTEDSFQEVDTYFQEQANMSRLDAMQDYVRYSASADDIDPWATGKPGIVIHEFNDEAAKSAVGADGTARTNIIMSY